MPSPTRPKEPGWKSSTMNGLDSAEKIYRLLTSAREAREGAKNARCGMGNGIATKTTKRDVTSTVGRRYTASYAASQIPESGQKCAVAFGQLQRILFVCRKTRL